MISKCPICLNKVVLSIDNFCPSCGSQITDLLKADPIMTTLELSSSHLLPNICYICGEKSFDFITMKFSSKITNGNKHLMYLIMLVLISLFVPFVLFVKGIFNELFTVVVPVGVIIILYVLVIIYIGSSQNAKNYRMVFKMPVCNKCKSIKKPVPKYIDYQNYLATFIVHKKFKEAMFAEAFKDKD